MKVGDYVRTNLKDEIVIRKVIDIIHSASMNDNRMVFDKPTKLKIIKIINQVQTK